MRALTKVGCRGLCLLFFVLCGRQLLICPTGLRIFPPVPGGNLRATPKGGAVVAGHRLPEGVTVSVQSWSVILHPGPMELLAKPQPLGR